MTLIHSIYIYILGSKWISKLRDGVNTIHGIQIIIIRVLFVDGLVVDVLRRVLLHLHLVVVVLVVFDMIICVDIVDCNVAIDPCVVP